MAKIPMSDQIKLLREQRDVAEMRVIELQHDLKLSQDASYKKDARIDVLEDKVKCVETELDRARQDLEAVHVFFDIEDAQREEDYRRMVGAAKETEYHSDLFRRIQEGYHKPTRRDVPLMTRFTLWIRKNRQV